MSVTKYPQKRPRNSTIVLIKKVQILRGKNGLNCKHRKAQNLILSERLMTCMRVRKIGAISLQLNVIYATARIPGFKPVIFF